MPAPVARRVPEAAPEGRQRDVREALAEHERRTRVFLCQKARRGSGSPQVPGPDRTEPIIRPPHTSGNSMRTIRNRKRTAALGTAVTAVLALALTPCGDDGGTKSAGPADTSASAEATVAAKDTAKSTNKDDAQGGTASDGAK